MNLQCNYITIRIKCQSRPVWLEAFKYNSKISLTVSALSLSKRIVLPLIIAFLPDLYLPFCLNLFSKRGSLLATVCFFNVPYVQNAGNQCLSDHLPFEQRGGALDGNANSVQYRCIRFFTAGDQRTFLTRSILSGNAERKQLVDDALDLCGDRVPVNRHGKDHRVRFQNRRGNRVESIVEGAGFSCLKA